MILKNRRDAWTVFGIDREHLDYKSFLTTYMGHPYAVSSASGVPVCNTVGDVVTGVVMLSWTCDFVGNTWNHYGPFTVV